MSPLFAWVPTGWELIVILVVGILLFGRRLPEVGRQLGKGIVEFKKGIKGVEDDVEVRATAQPSEPPRPPQRVGATAPKFEEPQQTM